jgi:hypothetical protein
MIEFILTEAEADVVASRAAWRASLGEGLLARHLAPLAAFALFVLFAAILGWTGLISRRAAETSLIGAAAAYMIYRLWTRRRFFSARRAAVAWAEGLRGAPMQLTLDDDGFFLESKSHRERWRFAEKLEIEEVAGLVYVWPKHGRPLVWPTRAHADAQAATQFVAEARRRAGQPPSLATIEDDDD